MLVSNSALHDIFTFFWLRHYCAVGGVYGRGAS